MISVERALRRRGNLLPGLWPVRATLILLLIVMGSLTVSGAALAGPLATVPQIGIAALFATIGFSAARPSAGATWRETMWDRLRVALPPYTLVVVAGVFVLGPLVTDRGLRSYGTDPDTYGYLLNLLGVPQYSLPGVFEFNNATDIVNAVVWIAPFYLLVLAVAALRPTRRWNRWVAGALAVALMLGTLVGDATDQLRGGSRDLTVMALQGDGASALIGGLLGAAAFHARAWLPVDWRVAGGSGLLIAVALRLGGGDDQVALLVRVGVAVPSAYLAVFLLLRPLPLTAVGQALAPYLPALLLFSFPVQQVVAQYGPKVQPSWLNLVLALPVVLLFATMWWRLIGRRLARRPEGVHRPQPSAARSVGRSLQTILRTPKETAIGYVAAGVFLLSVFLVMLWMLYIAMQPAPGDA